MNNSLVIGDTYEYLEKCYCGPAQMLSCVWLFATLWTLAPQVPLFMGFSRQEYLSKSHTYWLLLLFFFFFHWPQSKSAKIIVHWSCTSTMSHLIHCCIPLPWNTRLSSVQSLSRVQLFATPWIAARQASLSITNSWSSLSLTSIESVMPSSYLSLCRPLLLLPPIPPSIRVGI